MKITAILVTHNEAAMLPEWLDAVSRWADDIRIGLHDCTDDSEAVIDRWMIKNYDSRPQAVLTYPFPADIMAEHGFSYAKNKLAEKVAGDWIVSLDTDEEMNCTREQLEMLIEEAKSRRLLAIQTQTYEPRNYPSDARTRDELRPYMQDSGLYHWRIYKARAGVKWMGIIHEALHFHGQEINQYTLWQQEVRMLHFGPAMGHLKNREKSDLLYCELICRAFDFPHLRDGTNKWWFDVHYYQREAYLRAQQEEFWRRRGQPKYSELLDEKAREIWERK